jgi:hypothetical protein
MKKSKAKFIGCALLVAAATTMLAGCGMMKTIGGGPNDSVAITTSQQYQSTSPKMVKIFLPGMNKPSDYKVIGQVSIDNYTWMGESRSQDKIYQLMREKAAANGGQGLVDLKKGMEDTTASIIRYK